jgi:hypothetical protein
VGGGWVSEGSSEGSAGFCGPCMCLGIFLCWSVRCLCQGLQGLVLCKVGIVGWSAGDECVGGRCSLVTSWGRVGGAGISRGRARMRRGRRSSWEREQWIVAQEKEGE